MWIFTMWSWLAWQYSQVKGVCRTTLRGMTTLGAVLHRLAPDVVKPLLPPSTEQLARSVADVVIFDGDWPAAGGVGVDDIVLGVGLRRPDEVVTALQLLNSRPAALVVRAPHAQADPVRDAASASPITVVTIDEQAEWMQLTLLLREMLVSDEDGTDRDGAAVDDLFRVANAIEALVDAPVTIEDPRSRVLAFSEGQERADEARRATILGRRAPDEFYSRMKTHGVFKRLHNAKGVVFVPGRAPAIKPRAVMPVRASGEFRGSIWVVVDEPLDEPKQQALEVAARTVALHLLRQRLTTDSWRSAEIAAVSALLEGGPSAEEAARRLGLRGGGYEVFVAGPRQHQLDDGEALPLRMWDGLRMSLLSLDRHAVLGADGDRVIGVVPVAAPKRVGEPDAKVRSFIDTFVLHHVSGARESIAVGLGGAVRGIGDLRRSRDQAQRAYDIAARRHGSAAVVDIVEVGPEALVTHLLGAMDSDPTLGIQPLRRLQEHDKAKATQFAQTVAAWLDAFGDTDVAAAALNVHPNTVRYRIRQLRELNLIDLADPLEREALSLHLLRQRHLRASTRG